MPLFQYKGRNARGEAVSGRLEALSPDAVATQLFNTGVTPIDIVPIKASTDVLGALGAKLREGKVELQELILFCRQMYTLAKAGVPMLQALRGLRDSTQNPALANVLGQLADGLDAGLDLTTSLKRHPKVFSSLFVSLVQVGETTGNLDGAFLQLAKYLELEKDTRDRIKAAVRYPAFVLVAITAAMFIINMFVIPAFAKIYGSFHSELPWATKVLIATSSFTTQHWYWMFGFVLLVTLGVGYHIGTPEGRYRWHKVKLRLPVVGSIIYRAMLGRFARALSITMKAGVPLIQGLTVVSRAVDNDFISARIVQMRDGVERGETITRTAAATGMFPSLVVQMIAVGEDTGAVDDLMLEVGEYYEREVDYDLKNLSSAIEPILIIAIGIMVLILALGVFLPMWDLARAARGG
jgi:MSHA biogenesis protein MshG